MLRTLTPILLALAISAPAGAFHCEGYTTTTPDATVDGAAAGTGTYYVDDTCAVVGFVTSHLLGCGDGALWIYEESNGIPGLQRADEIVDDTCHGAIRGDTIAF